MNALITTEKVESTKVKTVVFVYRNKVNDNFCV
jgi:hypothetical protein